MFGLLILLLQICLDHETFILTVGLWLSKFDLQKRILFHRAEGAVR